MSLLLIQNLILILFICQFGKIRLSMTSHDRYTFSPGFLFSFFLCFTGYSLGTTSILLFMRTDRQPSITQYQLVLVIVSHSFFFISCWQDNSLGAYAFRSSVVADFGLYSLHVNRHMCQLTMLTIQQCIHYSSCADFVQVGTIGIKKF